MSDLWDVTLDCKEGSVMPEEEVEGEDSPSLVIFPASPEEVQRSLEEHFCHFEEVMAFLRRLSVVSPETLSLQMTF